MFQRTEIADINNNVIEWSDTNGHWGKSTFDDLNRQITYNDYSGYNRTIEYIGENIAWKTNMGFIFNFIKIKKGYKIVREKTT